MEPRSERDKRTEEEDKQEFVCLILDMYTMICVFVGKLLFLRQDRVFSWTVLSTRVACLDCEFYAIYQLCPWWTRDTTGTGGTKQRQTGNIDSWLSEGTWLSSYGFMLFLIP